jgi:transposase
MIYYVGIDVAKYKHDIYVSDEVGNKIREPFTISNDAVGFNTLLDVLKSLDGEIRIGMESTGHYNDLLAKFIIKSGYNLMIINPLLVRKFKQATTLRRTKTDKLDSLTIIKYMISNEYKPYPVKLYQMSELKELTRYYDSLIRSRTKILIKINNVMDKMFPEFRTFWNNKFYLICEYLIENYSTPEKMSRMNLNS